MSAICVETCNCLSSRSPEGLVEVMLDEHRYREKPPRGDPAWGIINGALARNRKALTLPELAELRTSGCTFAPGVFRDSRRSNDTWVQQQVFGLDFDHGWRVEEFLRLSERLGVRPAFVYPTFSHTDTDHRFRAVFVNDTVVTNPRLRKLIQGALQLLFVQGDAVADTQCSDAARFFLGSNRPCLHEEFGARINPFQLIDTCLKERKASDPSHYADHVRKLADTLGISCEPKQFGVICLGFEPDQSSPYVVGETDVGTYLHNTPTSISPDTMDSVRIAYKGIIYQILWKRTDRGRSINRTTPVRHRAEEGRPEKPLRRLGQKEKDELKSRCRLVREFITGAAHVGHHQRRILVTNLCHLDGGVAWYREGLAARTDYTADSLVEDARFYRWKPEGCSRCPHCHECDHKTNFLQQLSVKRRECRQVRQSPPGKTLQDTRAGLRETLTNCMAASENQVFVIKCDTGVGKTKELLRQNLDGVCLAFDTHRLKQEAHARLRAIGKHAYLWPEPPPLPDVLGKRLRHCYALGMGGTIRAYEKALRTPEVSSDQRWATAIEQYLEALREVHRQSRVLATHEKAYQLQRNPAIHTFVFDEDISKTLIRVDEVRPKDVEAFRGLIHGSTDAQVQALDPHLKAVLRAPTRLTIPQTPQNFSQSAIHQLLMRTPASFSSPMEVLFTCQAFRKDSACPNSPESIFCISRQALREDKKYIVLSATADERVYRLLFGERLVFMDLSGTALTGRLVCHTGKSFSKQCISSDMAGFAARVQEDQRRFGFEGIITHKFCAERREDGLFLSKTDGAVPVFGTFGGLQGLDSFGGRRLAVYGTPYPPEYVVKLWASALGLDVDEDEFVFEERDVEWGDYQLNVPTCSANQDVQRLYLWLAHSEIVQAVGRARLVSHNTEVHVFAKLPISGCRLEK